MMASGRRWTVRDRYNNEVYLTHERWEHITDPINHPEMAAYEEHLQDTIRSGQRRQDSLQPQKYRYVKAFDDLAAENTHLVAIVLCRFSEREGGRPVPNNYIVTAYQQEIG
jgi:hypothetical protein